MAYKTYIVNKRKKKNIIVMKLELTFLTLSLKS